MAETLNTRVTRLEKAMAEMAKSHVRLDNALAHLAEVQAKDEEEIRKEEEGIRQMKREALEREKRIDDRIEKLVSAIGEYIRRTSNGK